MKKDTEKKTVDNLEQVHLIIDLVTKRDKRRRITTFTLAVIDIALILIIYKTRYA